MGQQCKSNSEATLSHHGGIYHYLTDSAGIVMIQLVICF